MYWLVTSRNCRSETFLCVSCFSGRMQSPRYLELGAWLSFSRTFVYQYSWSQIWTVDRIALGFSIDCCTTFGSSFRMGRNRAHCKGDVIEKSPMISNPLFSLELPRPLSIIDWWNSALLTEIDKKVMWLLFMTVIHQRNQDERKLVCIYLYANLKLTMKS